MTWADAERHTPVPARRGAGGRKVAVAVALIGAAGVVGVLGAWWAIEQFDRPGCEFRVDDRVERFTPEQAANAATISMIAVDRDLPPCAATIALATAIQESKLRNISYGDADSLGLFQQRPSQGWGSQAQVLDPVFASNAFYDALDQVPDWEVGVITEVAQQVQRSAFPDAYADHEWEGRVLASVLTGQVPTGMGCDLEGVSGAGSPEAVLDKARSQFNAGGRTRDGQVVLSADSASQAWATASWAVAHAESEQIIEVEVAGRVWLREEEPLAWGTVTDGDRDGTTVTITVASG